MSIDMNATATLLNIVDLARQWPKLQAIHDLAMAQLDDINASAAVDVAARAKAAKAKQDAIDAAKAAEAKRLADEEVARAASANAAIARPALAPERRPV